MSISTLVVGLGKVGMLYKSKIYNKFNNHCDSIRNHKKFTLVAGVDKNFSKRKIFKKKYNLPVFSDLAVAWKNTKPKLIILSTPTIKNDKLFSTIKKKKVLPDLFFIEKPGSYNFKNLKNFHNFCKRKNIKIIINYQRSFSSSIKVLQNFCNNNKGLKINNLKVYYRKGFYNSCSHYINLFIEIFNPKKIIIKKIFKKRKLVNDFALDCDLEIKHLVNFRYRSLSSERIEFINTNNEKMIYYSEKSIIVIKKKNKLIKIKNNFNKNIKNVLDKISEGYKKKGLFNINKSLDTLKVISKIQKKNVIKNKYG